MTSQLIEHGVIFNKHQVLTTRYARKSQFRLVVTSRNSLIDGHPGAPYGHKKRDVFATPRFLGEAFMDPGPSPAGNPGQYLKCPLNGGPNFTYDEGMNTIHRVYSRIQLGDTIWVKETCRAIGYAGGMQIKYKATGDSVIIKPHWNGKNHFQTKEEWGWYDKSIGKYNWTPSIHMPKWASRIRLKSTRVRVERVQDISRADAISEGFIPGLNGLESYNRQLYGNAQLAFRAYWDDVSKPEHNWDANPLVWVYEFEQISNKEAVQ